MPTPTDARDIENAADQIPTDQVTKRWIVASTPDQAMHAIQPYIDAGMTHLVLHAPGADQGRFLNHLKTDLLPLLRAA